MPSIDWVLELAKAARQAAMAAAADASDDADAVRDVAAAAAAKATEDADAAEAAAKLAVVDAESLVAKQEQSLQALETALAELLRQIELRMWVDEFMEVDIRTEASTLKKHVQESKWALDQAKELLRIATAGLEAAAPILTQTEESPP